MKPTPPGRQTKGCLPGTGIHILRRMPYEQSKLRKKHMHHCKKQIVSLPWKSNRLRSFYPVFGWNLPAGFPKPGFNGAFPLVRSPDCCILFYLQKVIHLFQESRKKPVPGSTEKGSPRSDRIQWGIHKNCIIFVWTNVCAANTRFAGVFLYPYTARTSLSSNRY